MENKLVMSVAGIYNIQYAYRLYREMSKPLKSEEEKKDEEIPVKPPVQSELGTNVDFYW